MVKLSNVTTSKVYRKIVLAFGILTILLIGFIFYFSFSKTVISVALEPKEVTTNFQVALKKELAEEEKTTKLQGFLERVSVEKTKTTAKTTDEREVEDQARGEVTIYNNWSKDQPLAATTRLLTPDGLLFRIENYVLVPAGGKVEHVAVYADQKGPSGNVEPTKFTIPGLWQGLQDKIYAESTSAMTGGVRKAGIVTALDIKNARDALLEELKGQAKTDLEKKLAEQGNPTTISTQAIILQVTKEQTSVEPNQEAQEFTTTLAANAIVVIFKEEELSTMAMDRIAKDIKQDERIVDGQENGLTYSISSYDFAKQEANLDVTFKTTKVPTLASPIFNRDNLIGRDATDIRAYFSNFEEIGEVQIKFSPFWVTKAPGLKDHIEIRIH